MSFGVRTVVLQINILGSLYFCLFPLWKNCGTGKTDAGPLYFVVRSDLRRVHERVTSDVGERIFVSV